MERGQTVYQMKPLNIWLSYRNACTLTVELGLQTTYEATSDLINRAHSYELYVETVKRLRKYPKIEIVSHLINGLPGETHDMMIENVRRCVTDNDIQGIKLHLLHLMTNTRMQRDYHEGRLRLMSQGRNMLRSSVTNWNHSQAYRHPPNHRRCSQGYADWAYVEPQ